MSVRDNDLPRVSRAMNELVDAIKEHHARHHERLRKDAMAGVADALLSSAIPYITIGHRGVPELVVSVEFQKKAAQRRWPFTELMQVEIGNYDSASSPLPALRAVLVQAVADIDAATRDGPVQPPPPVAPPAPSVAERPSTAPVPGRSRRYVDRKTRSEALLDNQQSASLRPAAAARFLGIGESTLWRWAKEREDFPKPIRIGVRTTVWPADALASWLDAQTHKKAGQE